MKRVATALGCAAAVACSVALVSAAQTGTMAKDKMSKGMKTVMVTGCVAEGSTGHYVLTNATMSGGAMKDDTKGGMKGDMAPMSYGLMGEDLSAHVGHKVEVTGTMSSKMMKHDKMGKMDKDKDMDMDKMGTMHGTIDVKSVKMIASSCQ